MPSSWTTPPAVPSSDTCEVSGPLTGQGISNNGHFWLYRSTLWTPMSTWRHKRGWPKSIWLFCQPSRYSITWNTIGSNNTPSHPSPSHSSPQPRPWSPPAGTRSSFRADRLVAIWLLNFLQFVQIFWCARQLVFGWPLDYLRENLGQRVLPKCNSKCKICSLNTLILHFEIS